jgi:uncharacterized protein YdiU (UPF0061 family)
MTTISTTSVTPYAFLDDYDINNVCNHTDAHGRYSFGNQPSIGEWNLKALMQALSPLVNIEKMEKVLTHYGRLYTEHIMYLMGKKLGLDKLEPKDGELLTHLFGMMQGLTIDYTVFFRTLSHYNGDRTALLKLGLYHKPMNDWLDSYDKRLEANSSNTEERQEKMLKNNPKFVLKNYMLQEAIDAAEEGDFTLVDALFNITQNPYAEHEEYERWAEVTPDVFKNKKLSCSS